MRSAGRCKFSRFGDFIRAHSWRFWFDILPTLRPECAPARGCARGRGASRPTGHARSIDENGVMCFSLRVNIHWPLKFSVHHPAPITRIKLWFNESAFFRVPSQLTKAMGVIVGVACPCPRCHIARLRMIVPDQRLSIARGLILSFAARALHQHEQRSANQKQSSSHRQIEPLCQKEVALARGCFTPVASGRAQTRTSRWASRRVGSLRKVSLAK